MLTDRGRPGFDPGGVDGVLVSSASAVSWPAIIAGALAASAVTLALLIIGSGLGIAAFSPGSPTEHTITAISIVSVGWLIVVQWVASSLGGYLSGRLRTKWVGIQSDEVFFRDTAHGFLTWCLATLLSATVAISVVSSAAKIGAYTVGMAGAGGAAMVASESSRPALENIATNPLDYFVDSMFRSDHPNANSPEQGTRAEALRILLNGAKDGTVSETDKAYLAQLVSQRTGMPQADAQKRVNDTLQQIEDAKAKMHDKAVQAQKTGTMLSIFTFLSMLIGAFVASVGAALGGKRRDEY